MLATILLKSFRWGKIFKALPMITSTLPWLCSKTGWNRESFSIAITFLAFSASLEVRLPVPAPISKIMSFLVRCAALTIWFRTSSLTQKCWSRSARGIGATRLFLNDFIYFLIGFGRQLDANKHLLLL